MKSLEELEGGRAPAASTAASTSFDDLPVQRPSRPLPLGDSLPARMVALVAPLGYGQRALISGPPGSGATFLLRELGRALAQEGAHVAAVLVDVRPEEVPEWEDAGLEVAAADTGTSPREQVALAEDMLSRAKDAAARGEDAVLLLDSLSRLARAYALTGDRVGAVEATKRWFAAARDAGEGAGSLTLIAAARVETESSLEALVHETLADSANMVVRLNAHLAERGRHPAIDVVALPHARGGSAAQRRPPPDAGEHARGGPLTRPRRGLAVPGRTGARGRLKKAAPSINPVGKGIGIGACGWRDRS